MKLLMIHNQNKQFALVYLIDLLRRILSHFKDKHISVIGFP